MGFETYSGEGFCLVKKKIKILIAIQILLIIGFIYIWNEINYIHKNISEMLIAKYDLQNKLIELRLTVEDLEIELLDYQLNLDEINAKLTSHNNSQLPRKKFNNPFNLK